MFRFANAEYLYLLILIPLLVALLGVASLRRRHLLRRFGNLEIIKTLIPDFSQARLRLKVAIYLVALSLLIVASEERMSLSSR